MLGKIVSAGTTLLLTVALLGIAAAADLPGEPADSQAMDELSRTHYVSESEGDLLVYIITDPQCPHCHTLKKRIRELDTPGIEWRYVTVGFLGGESLKLAADKLERKLSVDGDQAVRKNTKVVTGIGVRAVPAVFYRTPQGEVRTFTGSGKDDVEALRRMAREKGK